MTATHNTTDAQARPSLLRRTWDMFVAFGEVMDPDPLEYQYESIRRLRQKVDDLELRLAALERAV